MKRKLIAPLLIGLMTTASVFATPFTIEMVADNDFAIFSGTDTGINNLLYQNDVRWSSQVNSISSLTFDLAAGDNMFYVLAMGASGNENISGLVNGVNMTDASVSVDKSSDVSSYLSNYRSSLYSVENGSYNAQLSDAQTALPHLTWSDASSSIVSSPYVISVSGFDHGFEFATQTAAMFRFKAEGVGVPEPASAALFGLGLIGIAFGRRRKNAKTMSA